jgi:hypothetical protein
MNDFDQEELQDLKSAYRLAQSRADAAWKHQATTTYAEGFTLCKTEAAALAAWKAEHAKDAAWNELQSWYAKHQPEQDEDYPGTVGAAEKYYHLGGQ